MKRILLSFISFRRHLTGRAVRRLRMRLREDLRKSSAASEDGLARQTERMIRGIIILLTVILIFLVVCLGFAAASGMKGTEDIFLSRNDFGGGRREESLILSDGSGEKIYSLVLEEHRISEADLSHMYSSMFRDLSAEMAGDNPSLDAVSEDLSFPRKIKGYPFSLTYEPDDMDYISVTGVLGSKAEELQEGESHTVKVRVRAVYRDFRKSHTFAVRITGKSDEAESSAFYRAEKRISEIEEARRGDKDLRIPSMLGGVTIKKEGGTDHLGIWLPGALVVGAIPVWQILRLRQRRKRCQKEAEKDFVMIVHQLTVYQRAGLSFLPAVRRINKDYRRRKAKTGNRYAFEQLTRMEQRVERGMAAREALRLWGEEFDSMIFQKLSMVISQSLTKGSREAGRLMEQQEQEAFGKRIELARKEGEEAGTRMLFPMILMLCQVMLIVIYPALIRFYNL